MKLITHFYLVPRARTLELYFHCPTCLHGIVLNYIIKHRNNLIFYVTYPVPLSSTSVSGESTDSSPGLMRKPSSKRLLRNVCELLPDYAESHPRRAMRILNPTYSCIVRGSNWIRGWVGPTVAGRCRESNSD
jgi:hypothetical protein